MLPPYAARPPVNGRTSPIRNVNEQLAAGAAVDAVVAVATAAPTAASASVARLILLDVSTGVPSSSSRCATGAATHDVATLNLISLKRQVCSSPVAPAFTPSRGSGE